MVFFEVLGGIAILVPKLRSTAGWGRVVLLITIFPANIHMAINWELFPEIPIAFLYVTLLLQFGIIYWAYPATRTLTPSNG